MSCISILKSKVQTVCIYLSINLSLILLACASPSAIPLSWTILSNLHHHLWIEAGACLRTCNAHIATFGTCVMCFTKSLCCSKYIVNLSLSLSLLVNSHKNLQQQERPDCKRKQRAIPYKHKSPNPSSLVKDTGSLVRPTCRHGFPRQRAKFKKEDEDKSIYNCCAFHSNGGS